ncbi:MAG: methyltransferase domain-containing protein [Gammaproteobacteria bacterium]|nr:methyltransferase domain-containing protein [Gammaproteobacteria bacterium]
MTDSLAASAEGGTPSAKPSATPSTWVLRFLHLIPAGGRVLDLACGKGRHTRLLAGRGHPVTAVDIDVSGLARLRDNPRIEIRQLDLETGVWPFNGEQFAAVLVCNYLHRPHFAWLPDALLPDGVLLMETFARGNEAHGRPRNPDHLLAPGELLAAFSPRLQVVAYEQGLELLPRPAVRQRICALNGAGYAALNAV